MLRILGSRRRLCNGLTRRDLLTVGGLGLLGLSASDLAATEDGRLESERAKKRGFGQARACILLYLYGSPSQLELFDMKPAAPLDVRGELKPIASSLAGLEVCEYLPRTARVMDRVTVVRSLTHAYPQHSISFALTGVPAPDGALDANPRDPRHWPFLGSVVSYLRDRTQDTGRSSVPDNLALPFPISSKRPAFRYAGFQPAFLGSGYAAIWTEFRGQGTQHVVRPAYGNGGYWEGKDPYLGIEPACRFEISPDDGTLPQEALVQGRVAEAAPAMTLEGLEVRRSLLEQFDAARSDLENTLAGRALSRHQELAFNLLANERCRLALDVTRETATVREAYGMTLFGQATLTARRLIEAGCRFVTVVWDEYGVHNTAWDTHAQHFQRMKGELLPALDAAYATLIRDLEERGLLDETLVLCISEHGRTPRVNNAPGGGRDHWSGCYTNWFAGGGIARGRVIGRSDKIGSSPVERPLSPKDILATVYYLLGFDAKTTLRDRLDRPIPLSGGEIVGEMMG